MLRRCFQSCWRHTRCTPARTAGLCTLIAILLTLNVACVPDPLHAGVAEGTLCIKTSWPGAIRGVFGDQQRFEETYFKPFPVRGMLDRWATGLSAGSAFIFKTSGTAPRYP